MRKKPASTKVPQFGRMRTETFLLRTMKDTYRLLDEARANGQQYACAPLIRQLRELRREWDAEQRKSDGETSRPKKTRAEAIADVVSAIEDPKKLGEASVELLLHACGKRLGLDLTAVPMLQPESP